MNYEGYYINLDRGTARREHMERQLARYGLVGSYRRFAGLDGNTIGLSGSGLTDSEIGCFASHLALMKQGLERPAHVHIIEDDAVFSSITTRALEREIASGRFSSFDILFTDSGIPWDEIRRHLGLWAKARIIRGPDAEVVWATQALVPWHSAASSYLVNRASLAKVERLLREALHQDGTRPFDFAIRHLTDTGALRTACLFPFSTTVLLNDPSTIEGRAGGVRSRFVGDAIRHLFFVERDVPALTKQAHDVLRRDDLDPMLDLLGFLSGFMLSGAFEAY